MNYELEIRTLTARFFEGETTLDEERRLYELYRTATHLPDDLAPLREMMGDWASLQKENEERFVKCGVWSVERDMPRIADSPEKGKSHSTLHTPHFTILALAASLLLLVGLATVWYAAVQRQNECVAYVYGERVTDRDAVMQEMQLAMNAVADDDATDLMEQQLRELFSE